MSCTVYVTRFPSHSFGIQIFLHKQILLKVGTLYTAYYILAKSVCAACTVGSFEYSQDDSVSFVRASPIIHCHLQSFWHVSASNVERNYKDENFSLAAILLRNVLGLSALTVAELFH